MKKVGFLIFIAAVVIGTTVGNLFSFGRTEVGVADLTFEDVVTGSGHKAVESRDVCDFTRVEVGGVFNVEITAGKVHAMQVEADDNLLQHIVTDVNNGVLEISLNEQVKSPNGITIRISAPEIESLEATGAANVSLNGVSNSELRIDSSGASKISVTGNTSEFIAEMSGASKINADELSSLRAHIDASGASKVSLKVSERLEVDSSGASSVTYSGTPSEIEKRTSGGASVSQR